MDYEEIDWNSAASGGRIRKGKCMEKIISTQEFKEFVSDIILKIRNAQYESLKVVNYNLICLYWDIGKEIYDRQNRYGWGKAIVEELSVELREEFAGKSGFSARNLWRMRNFYITFQDDEKVPPSVAEISWTKIYVILEKCKNEQEREFYFKLTRKYGWTKEILIHNISIKTYEKFLLNQTNFDNQLPEEYKRQAKLAIKDEYTFDFMELSTKHSEYELEQELVRHIQKFLSEMGGMFAFIGNQYKIIVNGDEFFIDLLLYHRKLRCLVAIELKIGKFEPADIGQLQFYLTALNEQERLPEENEAIGIIICRSKNRTVVEYALKSATVPMGVATYKISNELPEDMRKLLPEPNEIARRLDEIE